MCREQIETSGFIAREMSARLSGGKTAPGYALRRLAAGQPSGHFTSYKTGHFYLLPTVTDLVDDQQPRADDGAGEVLLEPTLLVGGGQLQHQVGGRGERILQ